MRTALLGAVGLVVAMGLGLAGGREFSTQEQSAGQRIDAWYDGLDGDCDTRVDELAVSQLVAGDLVITEVLYDSAAVVDSVGEWVELYNTTGRLIELNGLVIQSPGSGTLTYTLSGGRLLAANDWLVLGKSVDTAVNGGAGRISMAAPRRRRPATAAPPPARPMTRQTTSHTALAAYIRAAAPMKATARPDFTSSRSGRRRRRGVTAIA
jgi:hypothetical protein